MGLKLNFLLCILVFAAVSANAEEKDAEYEQILKTICIGNTGNATHRIWPRTGCQIFVTCDKERVHGPLVCPSGLEFDVEEDRCVGKSETVCQDTAPRTLFDDCTRRAVRGLCNNYTECDGTGVRITKNCGEQTVFSNTLGVCIRSRWLDKSEKIFCENGIIPPKSPEAIAREPVETDIHINPKFPPIGI